MMIKVFVVPNSRQESIEKEKDFYRLKVRGKPIEGKVNDRVIQLLAEYFAIAPSHLQITHGHKNRHKVIQVPDNCHA